MSAVTLQVDCLGQHCPRPIIAMARVIGDVPIGDCIELLADDPAAGPDLVAWCRMRGHEAVELSSPRFVVRRLH